eukprot:3458180-Lingulodinium_polyedra.AAC.1
MKDPLHDAVHADEDLKRNKTRYVRATMRYHRVCTDDKCTLVRETLSLLGFAFRARGSTLEEDG